jgi:hypothetical protein
MYAEAKMPLICHIFRADSASNALMMTYMQDMMPKIVGIFKGCA